MLLAIFRDMRQTSFNNGSRSFAGDILASQCHGATFGVAQAGEGLGQLGLPVALYPGDTQHLASMYLERDAA